MTQTTTEPTSAELHGMFNTTGAGDTPAVSWLADLVRGALA